MPDECRNLSFNIFYKITALKFLCCKKYHFQQKICIKSFSMGNLLFELNPSPMLIYDVESLSILKVNKAFHQKYKYTASDIAEGTLTIEHIRPKKNIPDLHEGLKKSRNSEGVHESGVYSHLSKTGEQFYMQVTSQGCMHEGQKARIAVFQDLTKRIEAEEKSLQAYEELQQHIANSPLASVKLDQNFCITEWSKRAEEISGYAEVEVLGLSLLEILFYEEERRDEIKRQIDLLVSGQMSRNQIESKIADKSGRPVYIRIHISTRRKENGKFKSALALIENLTYQKRIETHYKKLFEFARDGIYLLTKEGRFVDCNQRAADQIDIPVDELIGKEVAKFAPEYQPDGKQSKKKAREMTVKALKEGFSLFEWRIERPDGQFVDVEISLNSIHFPDREYIHAIARDITEKQVMLEEIHHRVKNNLAVISGILQLQAFDTDDENTQKALNDSQLRIRSMALVHEMLYQSENFSNISFEHYLHKLFEHIQKSLPLKSKNISVDIQAEQVKITMNQAVPAALLVNELITNAYKHAFNGGDKEGKIEVNLSKDNGDICMTVADNGKGLDEDFAIEESNSLGLNLIKTLAEQLEADLNYSSEEGAMFEFCIPAK